MGILKLKLTTQINQVLDRDCLPTGIPHGRWPAVWSMAKALFPPRRGGGGKGGRVHAPCGSMRCAAPCLALLQATVHI
jgi:hypothetical protein